ncbi:protein translocase subunit SecF [bacterium]|nr:protein translocase subunit SecF [bacterium]
MKSLNIMRLSTLWLTVSGVIVAASLTALMVFGLNYGVDFTGGTLLELNVPSIASTEDLRGQLESSGFAEIKVQEGEGGRVFVRAGQLTEDEHQRLLTEVQSRYADASEVQYTFVGPSVGSELRRSATIAIGVLLVLIALYVAWAFRNVGEKVSAWKFGTITLLTAAHDVIVPLGVFAVLGRVWGYQIDTAFVAAILTILGYSINDTIVVFDRTREHLAAKRAGESFRELVNKSVNETLGRSINTTLVVLLPLLAIFFVGGESTRPFVLALIVGVAAGAYSSLFLASPLLVLWQEKATK